MKKSAILLLSALAVIGCSSCGSSSSSSDKPASTTKAAVAATSTEAPATASASAAGGITKDQNGYTHYPTPENVNDFTGVDFSSPSIKIASGDYDKMMDIAKQIQSYTLEGVVIEIDGVVNSGLSHSIQIPNADGSKLIGTTIQVVGLDDKDFPADKTKVHIVGIIRPINEYAHGIIIAKENFQVVGKTQ